MPPKSTTRSHKVREVAPKKNRPSQILGLDQEKELEVLQDLGHETSGSVISLPPYFFSCKMQLYRIACIHSFNWTYRCLGLTCCLSIYSSYTKALNNIESISWQELLKEGDESEDEDMKPPEIRLEGTAAPLVHFRQHGQRHKEMHRLMPPRLPASALSYSVSHLTIRHQTKPQGAFFRHP